LKGTTMNNNKDNNFGKFVELLSYNLLYISWVRNFYKFWIVKNRWFFLLIPTMQMPKQYIKFGHDCSFTLLWHWEPLTISYWKWRMWYAAHDQLHTAVNVTNMLWHHLWTKNLGKENQILEYHQSMNCIWFK
jgi:hypothetical protein